MMTVIMKIDDRHRRRRFTNPAWLWGCLWRWWCPHEPSRRCFSGHAANYRQNPNGRNTTQDCRHGQGYHDRCSGYVGACNRPPPPPPAPLPEYSNIFTNVYRNVPPDRVSLSGSSVLNNFKQFHAISIFFVFNGVVPANLPLISSLPPPPPPPLIIVLNSVMLGPVLNRVKNIRHFLLHRATKFTFPLPLPLLPPPPPGAHSREFRGSDETTRTPGLAFHSTPPIASFRPQVGPGGDRDPGGLRRELDECSAPNRTRNRGCVGQAPLRGRACPPLEEKVKSRAHRHRGNTFSTSRPLVSGNTSLTSFPLVSGNMFLTSFPLVSGNVFLTPLPLVSGNTFWRHFHWTALVAMAM